MNKQAFVELFENMIRDTKEKILELEEMLDKEKWSNEEDEC